MRQEDTEHGIGTAPRAEQSSLLQVFTFYDQYLNDFYAANSALAHEPYVEQMRRLHQDGFGAFHVYAPFLDKAGVRSDWVIANCEQTQKRWALENRISYRPQDWKEEILRAQIAAFDPQILYTLNPLDFDSRFMRTLPKRPALIVGWRAAEIPATTDWSEFDLILSHLSVCRERALLHGAKSSAFFHPALPDFMRNTADDVAPEFDVVFSGQWTPQHHVRNQIITALAEAADRGEFTLGLYLCAHNYALPEVVKKYDAGARWGREMYRALKCGRIVVNAEIDLARGEAGNLRLYETTMVGSFLLTEHQTNIERYFTPGKHIDTYSSIAELLQKIRHYIANPSERDRKAADARAHMFKNFGMEAGARELTRILGTYLPDLSGAKLQRGGTMNQSMQVEAAIAKALQCLKTAEAGKALEIIETVAQFGDVTRDLHHVKAVCLSKLSRMDEAAVELRKEVKCFPDNHAAKDLLSFIEVEVLGSSPSTPAPLTLKLNPVQPASQTTAQPEMDQLNTMAAESMALLHKGDGVGAMRIADKLAARAPTVPGVNYLRVLCLNTVGRHEEALEAVKKELMVNPGHSQARATFEHLSQALSKKVAPPLNPEQRSYQSKLDQTTLRSIQNATHNYTYRGVPMIKNPFDFALYPLLLWDVKPKTIIEIGTKNGGSALWFGDMANNYGLDLHIYSIDIVKVTDQSHPRVTFLEGNGRDLGATVTKEWLASLPRPLLVIEDADHSYETSIGVLNFFHDHLRGDEYIVIEDGIISDLERDANCNSGPHRALKEFIAAHPGEYDSDSRYSDYFGYNYTWCTNGFLRKKKYPINCAAPKGLVREFLVDDPVPAGIESQMSVNERFQLYTAVRTLLPKTESKLRFVEIGSHAGASLKLEFIAAKRDGREVHPIAIEPGGLPSFYETISEIGATHIKDFSHPGRAALSRILQDGVRPELIMVDGDHTYEGVKQDILDYYDLLAPGGIMVFHDFLPALNAENREAIFFHHGGKEPGIRQACIELMEQKFSAQPVDLPLLYPTDPTQTQPHLPVIPGVFSTIRVYRKPR